MSSLAVLITGASGGIGSAIARRFASHPSIPFSILLHGRPQSSTKLEDLAKKLPTRHKSQKHTVLTGSVQSTEYWKSINWKEIPPPFVLVNAAGLAHSTLFSRMEQEDMEQVLDVNLLGSMVTCRMFGSRNLVSARQKVYGQEQRMTPSIVNVSSLLGTHGGLGAAAYAASKAGIIGLSRALAAEYGRSGIRVNTLVPGYIDTPMTQAENVQLMGRLKENIPLKRLGTADEVADAALFLALNNYANNCVLNIDGGLSATGFPSK